VPHQYQDAVKYSFSQVFMAYHNGSKWVGCSNMRIKVEKLGSTQNKLLFKISIKNGKR